MIDFKKEFIHRFPDCNIHYLDRYLRFVTADHKIRQTHSEKHHILPKSIWPEYSKSKDNLVKLSLKAHFLAHWIITKIISNNDKAHMAFFQMRHTNKYEIKSCRSYLNSRIYAIKAMENYQKSRVSSKTHNLLGDANPSRLASKNGTHKWLGDGNPNKFRLSEGIHNWSESHPNSGQKPWNLVSASNNIKNTWFRADFVYQIHLSNLNYGSTNLLKECKKIFPNLTSLVHMLKYFKSGWIPSQDPEWISFRDSHDE